MDSSYSTFLKFDYEFVHIASFFKIESYFNYIKMMLLLFTYMTPYEQECDSILPSNKKLD